MTQRRAVAAMFVAVGFVTIMDTTIVNVALPSIGRSLAVPPTAVAAISIAYLVAMSVVIPTSGWLAARVGPARLLLIALTVFTVGSALCAIADSLTLLVVFRIAQGVGGGVLTPVGMAMLYRQFAPEERVRLSRVVMVPTLVAPAAGPVVGGLLVSALSWRWVFLVNVPIGLAAIAFGLAFLGREDDAPRVGRFDGRGFALCSVALGLTMYGLSEGPTLGWTSARVLVAVGAGVALLPVAVTAQLRVRGPLLDLRVLNDRLFRCGCGLTTAVGSCFIGVLYAVSLYFQEGRGLSPVLAGLSTFPEAIGVMAGTQLAGALYPAIGPRRLAAAGTLGVVAASVLLSAMGAQTSLWWARLIMFGLGFAAGHVFLATQSVAFATVTPTSIGDATTLFSVLRQLAGAVGVAALTTVLGLVGPTRVVAGHRVAHLAAYRVTFLAAAAVALTGLAAVRGIRDADVELTVPAPGADRRLA